MIWMRRFVPTSFWQSLLAIDDLWLEHGVIRYIKSDLSAVLSILQNWQLNALESGIFDELVQFKYCGTKGGVFPAFVVIKHGENQLLL